MSYPIYQYEKSAAMFQRAQKVIPSGVYGHKGPAEGCFVPITAYPFFAERAQGTYFWDVDGNRFIDYMCSYGPNVLGYNDEDVDAAAREQHTRGDCLTAPTPQFVELAELMVDTVKSADWAFFAKNGGDATTLAILTARAHTQRKKIVFFKGCYHGVAPWAQKIDYPGIISEDVANNIYVHWNDTEELARVFAENKGEIAAVMSMPYMHQIFADNELPAEGFWPAVRKLCDENGALLILDDVRCGFRLDLAGSDHFFGFEADLICFCKAIANGYNLSALCGKEFLKNSVSSITATGSYWLSAVPFAAAIACIKKMKYLDLPKALDEKGRKLKKGLLEVAGKHGYDLHITGMPALFYLRLADDDTMMLHQRWISEMVKRGAYFSSHHNHFINYALSDEDIEATIEIADEAFRVI